MGSTQLLLLVPRAERYLYPQYNMRPRGTGHIRRFPRGKTEYKLIRVRGKQQLEHRVIAAKAWGEEAIRGKVVHHKDEQGLHNDPCNFEVLTRPEHRRRHMGLRKWSISIEDAVKLRDERQTLAEIAARAGVTPSAVRLAFLRRGISTRDARHGTTQWPLEEAVTMWGAGARVSAIARAMGVAGPTVKKALAKLGLWPRKSAPVHRGSPAGPRPSRDPEAG